MTDEAKLEQGEHGLVPQDGGWYVANLRDVAWRANPRFGVSSVLEGPSRFPQLGLNVHVLQPDQPACLYHSERMQEGFLVLEGECTLVVEEQERTLRKWDYFHCAPETRHVFVGAGDGPCAILMVGARFGDQGLDYPVSEVAARHGASAAARTPDPREAYAGTPPSELCRAPWPTD